MKLITACLLGLLSANVYALDCWGYMNKPKAEREACMAQMNDKLKQPTSSSQREIEAQNRQEAQHNWRELWVGGCVASWCH